jgi:oxidase EvaA
MSPAGSRLTPKTFAQSTNRSTEEGSRFWRKSNENMILFVEDASQLKINESIYRWASLSQIKQMLLLDNVVGPYVRTAVAPL